MKTTKKRQQYPTHLLRTTSFYIMKKTIFFLLFLLQFCALEAQHDVTWGPNTGSSAYECTIVPASGTSFQNLDLLTWIFPDGQFFQQEIETDQLGQVIKKSDTFLWQPSVNAPSGPNDVVTYVAKKGQPGNPPKRTKPTPTISTLTGSPALFALAAGKSWQINRSWEFSPGNETFLIVSYRCDFNAPNSNITLTYDPKELNLVTTTGENLAYQNEIIGAPTTNGTKKDVKITNFNFNGTINHVYVKFILDNAVKEGSTIAVGVSGSICDQNFSDEKRYVAQGNPHDPNQKSVDKPTICTKPPGPIPLKYYIRFHNDGTAAVNEVDVEDNLPPQLDPNTCSLDAIPNSSTVLKQWKITGNQFLVQFQNLHLPGLKQTNPHYAYDQTCYDFTFSVSTQPNLTAGFFFNSADVYFLNSMGRLPVVPTNLARVTVDS